MPALVIYESMYGDNQQIAGAICEGLQTAGVEGQAIEVGIAPTAVGPEVELLVVGCPNHAWGMPRPATRASARDRVNHSLVSEGPGVREWLRKVHLVDGVSTAAYDTRVSGPSAVVAMDHAAHSIEKALSRRGGSRLVPAEHFVVVDAFGPLADGEMTRAQQWGADLARTVRGLTT